MTRFASSVLAMTTDLLTRPRSTRLVSRALLLRFVSIVGSSIGFYLPLSVVPLLAAAVRLGQRRRAGDRRAAAGHRGRRAGDAAADRPGRLPVVAGRRAGPARRADARAHVQRRHLGDRRGQRGARAPGSRSPSWPAARVTALLDPGRPAGRGPRARRDRRRDPEPARAARRRVGGGALGLRPGVRGDDRWRRCCALLSVPGLPRPRRDRDGRRRARRARRSAQPGADPARDDLRGVGRRGRACS